MKIQIFAAAAIALSCAGSAFAQTSPRLEDKTIMAPFYTDAEMKEMRSGQEFSAALSNLTSADREAIKNECGIQNTQRSNFCDQFMKDNN